MLSSYQLQLCQGHLEAVFHIFAYLWKNKRSKVVFDNTCMNWGNKFQAVDWRDFYLEASELIPPNVLEPCGKCVQLNCFVDVLLILQAGAWICGNLVFSRVVLFLISHDYWSLILLYRCT